MAYKIVGYVHQIGPIENIPMRNGNNLQKRKVVLMQKRSNPTTGEEYEPNYPQLEFTGNRVSEVDNLQLGLLVEISFEISGLKYSDRTTGEDRFMSILRAFKAGLYVSPNQQVQTHYQQPTQPMQPAPQQWQQPQQPQQQWAPPQQPAQPAPQSNDLPF